MDVITHLFYWLGGHKPLSELSAAHTHPYLSDNHPASGVTSAKISNWDAAYTHSQSSHNYAAASHTHTKSLITDFPTSMPANGGTATNSTVWLRTWSRGNDVNITTSSYHSQTRVFMCDGSTPNKPDNIDGFMVNHSWDSAGWALQTYYEIRNYGRLHTRYYDSSSRTYSTWKTVAWTSEIPNKVSLLTNDSGYLTSHQDISGKHPLNGKITRSGGSYSWYNIQQYNSSNANPAYYTADCAIININSYTGWQPWIRAVDSENGSWVIGQYTNQLHIGRIPKTNTGNSLTYSWTCGPTGNFTISGAFYANSDIRYKNVILYINPSIEDIANLSMFNYKWNDRDDNVIHTGSSALEVELILPNLVTEREDGFKSLDYATLGTIASITVARELVLTKKEIELIKKENLELKQKINMLLEKNSF